MNKSYFTDIITSGNLLKAMEKARSMLSLDTNQENQLLLQISRVKMADKKWTSGAIRDEDYHSIHTNVTYAFLEFLDEVFGTANTTGRVVSSPMLQHREISDFFGDSRKRLADIAESYAFDPDLSALSYDAADLEELVGLYVSDKAYEGGMFDPTGSRTSTLKKDIDQFFEKWEELIANIQHNRKVELKKEAKAFMQDFQQTRVVSGSLLDSLISGLVTFDNDAYLYLKEDRQKVSEGRETQAFAQKVYNIIRKL
jgi:hypothetical protein